MTEALEAQLLTELRGMHEHAMVLAERVSDGRRWHVAVGGVLEPDSVWFTSSTTKPVSVACLLHQVALGRLSLDTRVVDVLPGFQASGVQTEIRLSHLLAFNSGLELGATPWRQPTWEEYVAEVEALPSRMTPAMPGVRHTYVTEHLDVAGLMAVAASGLSDWQSVFREWAEAVGVFQDVAPGERWNSAYIVAPSVSFDTTCSEYARFWGGLADGQLLPPELTALMFAQGTPHGGAQKLAAANKLGEDWRFTMGLWIESRAGLYSETEPTRFASLGIGGQYHAIDWVEGWRIVVGQILQPQPALRNGLDYVRRVEPLLHVWAEA